MARSAKQQAALKKAQLASIIARAAKATPESRQRRRVKGALRRSDAAKRLHASGNYKIPGTDMHREQTRKVRLSAVENIPRWEKLNGGFGKDNIAKAKADRRRMVRKVMGKAG